MNAESYKDMNGILETDKDKEIEAVKGKILFEKNKSRVKICHSEINSSDTIRKVSQNDNSNFEIKWWTNESVRERL